MTGLPKQYRSGLVVKRAREVAAMVPEHARGHPSVRELRTAVDRMERRGRETAAAARAEWRP